MTVAEVLALAQARGVTIRLDGAELELSADRKPDSDLLDAIAGRKADIVAFLHPDAVRRRLEAEAGVLRAPRPPDVTDVAWKTAIDGLRAFIAGGYGAEAERCGWTKAELYRVPELWSQIHLTGAGLLIGDREVVENHAERDSNSKPRRARRWPTTASPRSTTASPTVRASSSSASTPARKSFSCARSKPRSTFTAVIILTPTSIPPRPRCWPRSRRPRHEATSA